MIKKLTCIECPKGCALSVEIDNCKVVSVKGNECPKGEKYAVTEVENPVRILTSTVLSEGLALKMIPVRTTNPIPKDQIFRAMKKIKNVRVKKAVCVGDIIVRNFLVKGTHLIATRDCL